MIATVVISVMVLFQFNFNILEMFSTVSANEGPGFLNPGGQGRAPIDSISLS